MLRRELPVGTKLRHSVVLLGLWCIGQTEGALTNTSKPSERASASVGALFYRSNVTMQDATEGTIKVTTDWWPRPGSDEPLEKETFFTKVGGQMWCWLL